MLISDELNFFKKTFVATSSEACALTPRKCFAEEGTNVQKMINLAALLCSSEIIIF